MKKLMTKVAASTGVMVLTAAVAFPALADFTGNVAATNNYVWRGLTQTGNVGAVSGGLDYSHDSGIYVGTWVSDTEFGSQELDYYAGFSKEFDGLGIDVGVISYVYPQTPSGTDADWNEIYIGFSFDMFSLQINSSSDIGATDTDGLYIEAAIEHDIAKDLTLGLHVGSYDFDDEPVVLASLGLENYTDYMISLTKGEFTFAVSDTDLDEALGGQDHDMKVLVTWAREFDLLK